MTASVGLAIQCVGIVLVMVLMLFMRTSVRSTELRYWTMAWFCLSLSLFSLWVGFHVGGDPKFFYALYFFGEYAFGLMFIAGCRYHSTGAKFSQRDLWPLIVGLVIAVALPYLSKDFNDLFMVQATIMVGLFLASFLALRPARAREEHSPGLRLMSVALLLLTLDFLHYLPVFGARKGLLGFTVPAGYLRYTSIFDLILEIMLGFGTVMVLMETVRRELITANKQLLKAHEKLELMAQMDPLTEALNRHAFHSLLNRSENAHETNTSGSVVIIDIDNLKPINDSWGHNAGDRAIRAVARGMRSLIRADDMLFRWGGDEFLVLMFKLPEEEANRRMLKLNGVLAKNCQQWTSLPISVTVSYGLASFGSLAELRQGIDRADRAMYARRQQTRGRTTGYLERESVLG
ncbi:MAG: GGDEF domain-containing protein [Pyrinomonadaceae bacterium]